MAISVSVCLCLFVCLSVRSHVSYQYTSKFHQIFCTCYGWQWLLPHVTAMQYVMYFRFGDDVTFSHNGADEPGAKSAVSDCMLSVSVFYCRMYVTSSSRSCSAAGENTSEEARLRRRREQNRLAAQRSRERQKNLTTYYLKVNVTCNRTDAKKHRPEIAASYYSPATSVKTTLRPKKTFSSEGPHETLLVDILSTAAQLYEKSLLKGLRYSE